MREAGQTVRAEHWISYSKLGMMKRRECGDAEILIVQKWSFYSQI